MIDSLKIIFKKCLDKIKEQAKQNLTGKNSEKCGTT